MCDHRLADGHMQDVQLHVLAPAGTVKVRCSICAECRPTPATLESTTARLLERLGLGDIQCPACARVLLPEPFN